MESPAADQSCSQFKVVMTGKFGVGKSTIFQRFALGDREKNARANSSRRRQTKNGFCSVNTDDEPKIPDGKAGKTGEDTMSSTGASYNRQLTQPSAPDNHCRTFTTSTRQRVQLELWDTAGMERFSSLSGHYYANASAVLVVYSVDSDASLTTAVDCIIEAIEAAASGRLATNGGGLVVFLCGNKADYLADVGNEYNDTRQPEASAERIARVVSEFDRVVCGSYIVSCRSPAAAAEADDDAEDDDDVEKMFADIAEVLDRRKRERVERIATQIRLSKRDNATEQSACGCL